ncbi:MAG: SufS family cysteine desulfurase [Planctomycetaceae bacterium]|jgi:cysteine desulfurase/selenocysteine lyase|nr:SufS family cysteine desulfurase [Planctomycetaceae bacterium]
MSTLFIDELISAAVQDYTADFFPVQNPFSESFITSDEDDIQQVWREVSKTLYDTRFDGRLTESAKIPQQENTPYVNTPYVTTPYVNTPYVNTPFANTLYANTPAREFDVTSIRKDFPILSEQVHGKPLIWFDNGATTQKPNIVIERLKYFYEHENSNIHRGAHDLAARSTDAYEHARAVVRKFINASSTNEIIFVRGTTEAINLVAASWGRDNIHAGDEIIVSHLEHHANIVPWQLLAQETGALLKVIPVDDNGELLLNEYTMLLKSGKVKLVAVTQVSNAIGTVTPTEEIIRIAHQFGCKVLIDGAQSVSHIPTDVQLLDTDFFVFSGHKIFAPTGIGILYGKEELLNMMRPYQGGGGMIADVTFEKTEYQPAPGRFEAGTGNIADAVGLGAALDYVGSIGIESIRQYEHRLLEYARLQLAPISGLQIIGNPRERAGVISFVVDKFSTEEINKALAAEGIALRSGHHCAQPILRRFGLESTVRVSLAFYNTVEEVDFLVKTLSDFVKVR